MYFLSATYFIEASGYICMCYIHSIFINVNKWLYSLAPLQLGEAVFLPLSGICLKINCDVYLCCQSLDVVALHSQCTAVCCGNFIAMLGYVLNMKLLFSIWYYQCFRLQQGIVFFRSSNKSIVLSHSGVAVQDQSFSQQAVIQAIMFLTEGYLSQLYLRKKYVYIKCVLGRTCCTIHPSLHLPTLFLLIL